MAFQRKITDELLELIIHFEGFISKPVYDGNGFAIGYGCHTDENGNPITAYFPEITKVRGVEILKAVLGKFIVKVAKLVPDSLEQHQFDALVSFAYNLGIGTLSNSKLLRKVKQNPADSTIRDEFYKFTKTCVKDNNGNKSCTVSTGLMLRRYVEYEYYSTGKLKIDTKAKTMANMAITNEDKESDAVSDDSNVQIKYVNTNSCYAILCNEDKSSTQIYLNANINIDNKLTTTIATTGDNNGLDYISLLNVIISFTDSGGILSNWRHDRVRRVANNIVCDRLLADMVKYDDVEQTGGLSDAMQPIQTHKLGILSVYINYNSTYALNIQSIDSGGQNKKNLLHELIEKHEIKYNELDIATSKFEDAINKGINSMFDTLYRAYKKHKYYHYTKYNSQSEYDAICNHNKNLTITDSIIKANIGEATLAYIVDCSQYENLKLYLNNNSSAILLVSNYGVVRFSVGKNRGIDYGWDDVHMLKKLKRQ